MRPRVHVGHVQIQVEVVDPHRCTHSHLELQERFFASSGGRGCRHWSLSWYWTNQLPEQLVSSGSCGLGSRKTNCSAAAPRRSKFQVRPSTRTRSTFRIDVAEVVARRAERPFIENGPVALGRQHFQLVRANVRFADANAVVGEPVRTLLGVDQLNPVEPGGAEKAQQLVDGADVLDE